MGYGLDDRGPMVRFPAGVGNFSLSHCIQTGSEAQSASYPVGIGDFSPGLKWLGRETYHSLPSSAEVKYVWSYTPTPLHTFMA